VVNGSLGVIRNIVVSGNIVARIAYPSSAHGVGIYVERNSGGAAGFYGSCVVTGNQVFEVGVPAGATASYTGTAPYGVGIQLGGTLVGVNCSGNLVQNSTYIGFIGIAFGYGGSDAITGLCSVNEIKGAWKTGILNASSGNVNSSTVANNIELTDTTPYTDQQVGIVGATNRHVATNNIILPNADDGFISGCAQGVEITVNVSIVAGVISYTTGFDHSKYVVGVASHANGLQINFVPGMAVQHVSISQTSSSKAVVTSGAVDLDYIYIRDMTSPLLIGLQSLGTDMPAADCTGEFSFRISI
jgi:hypothetical protein